MELYLQFGYGMMEHCRWHIAQWGHGNVILSPRDLKSSQLDNLAKSINNSVGGGVFLDPQMYLPHSDHERLTSHIYWPSNYQTGAFWGDTGQSKLLTDLQKMNQYLRCKSFILPGLLAQQIDEDWLAIQRMILEEARSLQCNVPLMPTIALSANAVRNDSQIGMLLDSIERDRAEEYYIVCQHPDGEYLVADPTWISNIIDLVAGIRLAGSRVVLGYCNHQMLIAAAARANAIASGTWMNVRSFPPDKFRMPYDDEAKQRKTWYYCPQALSEYGIAYLDIARKQGVLDLMAPPPDMDDLQVSVLFSGVQPSTVGFTEQAAFRHYLNSLYAQVNMAEKDSFDETVSAHQELLDGAETVLAQLANAGLRLKNRNFTDIVEANRVALSTLVNTRGPMLRRFWNRLS